jgi:hypothetical protein
MVGFPLFADPPNVSKGEQNHGSYPDATFEQVRLHLSPREIVEVLLTVGYYQMLARLMTILEIDLDAASGTQVSDAAQSLQRHGEERPPPSSR